MVEKFEKKFLGTWWVKNYEIKIVLHISPIMKSVKFWRENPANEHSISSGKFRIQKIREIRSSQFIADCNILNIARI